MNVKTKGGWTMDRERFSDEAIKVLEVAIDHRRQGLKLGDDALRGVRFNNNDAILARLESICTESEFMECPGLRIDNALIDAVQSDRWYATEKDYGDEWPSDETEIVDED